MDENIFELPPGIQKINAGLQQSWKDKHNVNYHSLCCEVPLQVNKISLKEWKKYNGK